MERDALPSQSLHIGHRGVVIFVSPDYGAVGWASIAAAMLIVIGAIWLYFDLIDTTLIARD
jgi:hypothetical protein